MVDNKLGENVENSEVEMYGCTVDVLRSEFARWAGMGHSAELIRGMLLDLEYLVVNESPVEVKQAINRAKWFVNEYMIP